MIAKPLADFLANQFSEKIIPANIVATVRADNNLEHAFLVLSKVKYAKIPVLDNNDCFVGLLSLAMITNTMLDLTGINANKLSKMCVSDVMAPADCAVEVLISSEKVLHLLVDKPFLVVVDANKHFKGIITRREVLKGINKLIHQVQP